MFLGPSAIADVPQLPEGVDEQFFLRTSSIQLIWFSHRFTGRQSTAVICRIGGSNASRNIFRVPPEGRPLIQRAGANRSRSDHRT
jgi:hypothetical protein